MFKNHPKGLIVLALANMGERFGYYTMIAILTLYLQAKFGFSSAVTSVIYGSFLALIYFLPVFGGIIADKWLGYGKTILIGISIMFAGYLSLGLPLGTAAAGLTVMFIALILISCGTGLFKGNLQALVGKLYDNPAYSKNRDMAFSIFYMFINIGAFFAPSVGNAITNSILGREQFYYDASIPNNYVKLNDKTVDQTAFISEYAAQHQGFDALSAEEQAQKIKAAKKKDGVMFPEDEAEVLLNLKIAGLHQYTESNVITDPALMVTKEDYNLLQSKNPEDAPAQQAIRERVAQAEVPVSIVGADATGDFPRAFGQKYVTATLSHSYSLAFFVACISLIFSILIFIIFRSTWKAVDVTAKQAKAAAEAQGKTNVPTMSKQEVRERLIALGLVFVVVIFFWMSFHQNGLTMTFFARDYTVSKVTSSQYMVFSLFILIPFIVFMYGIYLSTFGLLGGKKNAKTGIWLIVAGIVLLIAGYFVDIRTIAEPLVNITPQIFLTPVTVGIFTALARKGKEPSAPRKIGIGMLLAAVGFLVLLFTSVGLPAPSTLQGTSSTLVSPNALIGTYFVLTLAELFLSPMGLSFVSKVAPPQYAGLMQGGWLAATAVGNLLVGVMGSLWDKMSLVAFWGILIACCLLSAAFIFSVMKRLERVTK